MHSDGGVHARDDSEEGALLKTHLARSLCCQLERFLVLLWVEAEFIVNLLPHFVCSSSAVSSITLTVGDEVDIIAGGAFLKRVEGTEFVEIWAVGLRDGRINKLGIRAGLVLAGSNNAKSNCKIF